jgi:flagellar biosynthesis anti-sigma factor FlgM
MKVNDPNLSTAGPGIGSIQSGKADQMGRAAGRNAGVQIGGTALSDDVHLSELVRSLRSLAADSPERQAKIEQLTRAYADGSYKPDPEATAAAMIRDATARYAGEK